MKNIEDMNEEEILAEYLKRYPKKLEGPLFEFYSGENGINIKYKKRKQINFLMEKGILDTLYVNLQYEEFWDKVTNAKKCDIYLWGCSVLLDFGDDFYYELGIITQEIEDYYNSNKSEKKIKISKYNSDMKRVEQTLESDIIVL